MSEGSVSDDGAERSERSPIGVGALIAKRYRLTRLLGAGTSGTVYEAEHTLLTSRVAIKFLDGVEATLPERAEIMLERFRFEAQVSARLAPVTDHIVAAQDAGLHDGVPYLVMELAPGASLEARISERAVSPEETVDIIRQIGDALDAAHAAGIAHRDVKPANVLCVERKPGEPGLYKLADFGVAKRIGDRLAGVAPPKATAENTLLGSPAYMSPEYVSGAPVVDGKLDIWALGVLAYEALTREIPFDGEVWTQVAVAIVQGDYRPATEHVPTLPPAIDAFFARAFAQDPAARFATAAELAAALAAALGDVAGDADVALLAGGVAARGSRASLASMPRASRASLASNPGRLPSMPSDERTDAPVALGDPDEVPKRRAAFIPLAIAVAALALVALLGIVVFSGGGSVQTGAAASGAAAPTSAPSSDARAASTDAAIHADATSTPSTTATVAAAESASSDATAARPTATAPTKTSTKIKMKRPISKSEIP
ncbi:MAG TPA: serine/threonine-protein kinase [Polyangiaceae bacterium]|nr:serine/threonine-protein kinase [Polyangiaceae bacterium]